MIRIELHRNFVKAYDKRIKSNSKLAAQTQKRVSIFKANPRNQLLKDHGLIGSKNNLRSFSVSGDIRIIYKQITDNYVIFYDIGSHNQIY